MKAIIRFLTDDEDYRLWAQLIKGAIGAGFVYMWLILLASLGK